MDNSKAVVDCLYLFNQSPDHRLYTIAEFNHYAVYPIIHGKAIIFYEDEKPVGFVTWAWLTPEEGNAFLSETWVPDEEVYKRPDKIESTLDLWGIEFIAPYGHTLQVMRGMRQHSLKHLGQHVPAHWRRLKQPDRLHRRKF